MIYPKGYIYSRPTPATLLVVCDSCKEANWTIRRSGVHYCYKCNSRKREGKEAEYKEAVKAIEYYGGKPTGLSITKTIEKRFNKGV